jgi:hypothetical protein
MDFKALENKIKTFDWRSLKKYADPKASEDLNVFLEKLPQNTGQTMLIIAAIVWSVAGAVGLYTTVQLQQLTEIRTELQEAQALQPTVPKIQDIAVNANEVSSFINKIKETYKGLDIKASGTTVRINAKTTSAFGQFREAVGHIQNGGSGWRVNIEYLCVGRECDKYPLSADLRINKVSVSKPG